eukprot:7000818-Prymnesium_polylepis.1
MADIAAPLASLTLNPVQVRSHSLKLACAHHEGARGMGGGEGAVDISKLQARGESARGERARGNVAYRSSDAPLVPTCGVPQLLAREPSDEYIALDDILYNLKEDDIEAEDFWDTLVGGRGPVHRAPGAEEDRVATTL